MLRIGRSRTMRSLCAGSASSSQGPPPDASAGLFRRSRAHSSASPCARKYTNDSGRRESGRGGRGRGAHRQLALPLPAHDAPAAKRAGRRALGQALVQACDTNQVATAGQSHGQRRLRILVEAHGAGRSHEVFSNSTRSREDNRSATHRAGLVTSGTRPVHHVAHQTGRRAASIHADPGAHATSTHTLYVHAQTRGQARNARIAPGTAHLPIRRRLTTTAVP